MAAETGVTGAGRWVKAAGGLTLCALSGLGAWAGSCAPSIPDGTTREVRLQWPNEVVRTTGHEVRRSGKWVKTGEFVFFDENGDETHRGSYTDGLEDGAWVERTEDGQTARGAYVAGRRDGQWKYYYPNGKLAEQGAYLAGARIGTWRQWSAAGEPRPDKVYDKPQGGAPSK
ncbi:MAG: hypothetical protein R3F49_18120 [Planctomycetota bacterium]